MVDSIEPPGGGTLGPDRLEDLVGLDEVDPGIAGQRLGLVGGQPHGEALERVLIDVGDGATVSAAERLGQRRDERPW